MIDHLTIELARQLIRKDLPPADEARWRTHVDECPRCRRLLDEELALQAVLDLGDAANATPLPASLNADRLLARLEALIPGAAAQRRRRQWTTAVGGVAAALLAGLLIWQLARTPSESTRVAQQLRIDPDLQAKVVARLDALRTLQRDPWVADELETVQMFEALLASHPTEP